MIEILNFLKKNAIVEINYIDINENKCTIESCIEDVLDDKLLLCFPQDKFPNINSSSKIYISVCTDNGVLSGNINFLKEKDDKSIFVSFPYNNMISQRRENSRFPLHIDLELTVGDEQYNLKTKNISGKGFAVFSDNALPDFDNAKVKVSLFGKDIVSSCRKIYSKEIVSCDKTKYLSGIAMTTVNTENIEYIIRTCTKSSLQSQQTHLFSDL